MGVFFRRRQVSLQAHQELLDQFHGLLLRVKHLEEDLAALETKHERLRGRFYAKESPTRPPVPTTKGAILRQFGYAPGQPVPPPTE